MKNTWIISGSLTLFVILKIIFVLNHSLCNICLTLKVANLSLRDHILINYSLSFQSDEGTPTFRNDEHEFKLTIEEKEPPNL